MRLKLRQLESYLEDVDAFENPKVLLEQYPTRAHIASAALFAAQSSFGDIEDKLVADLGCGCGVLSIGSVLLGASHVVGFEIDGDALRVCRRNLEGFDIRNCDLVQADVAGFAPSGPGGPCCGVFDTVFTNPPFGTKHNKGADLAFVKAGLNLVHAKGAVYSLHKTSTRDHVLKKAGDFGAEAKVLAELRYDLPASYKHHKKTSVDIEVDFVRFTPKRTN